MDVERIIDEIEQLQEMFEAPDIRPLSPSDISAANRRHDEMLAPSPCAGIFVTDYLRPAALAAGVQIADGQRFALHSLRSCMATWMISIDKTDMKTAQGNMRHAGPVIMLRHMLRWSRPKCTEFSSGGLTVVGWVWVRTSWCKTPGAMQSNEPKRVFGERGRIRSCDPCLKRVANQHTINNLHVQLAPCTT
jgi:hypothetical protein